MISDDIAQVIDTFYYALPGIHEGYSMLKKWDSQTAVYVPATDV
jgi:hypothetical protein